MEVSVPMVTDMMVAMTATCTLSWAALTKFRLENKFRYHSMEYPFGGKMIILDEKKDIQTTSTTGSRI